MADEFDLELGDIRGELSDVRGELDRLRAIDAAVDTERDFAQFLH